MPPPVNKVNLPWTFCMTNLSVAQSRSIVAQDRQLQCEYYCHRWSTKTPLHEIPTDSWVPCIHTSYYQKTASKRALTTSGLLDGMSLLVNGGSRCCILHRFYRTITLFVRFFFGWYFVIAMEKTVFTHQISPYFYTNVISPNQRAWSTAKDIPSNGPDVVRAHLEVVFW